MGFRSTFRGEAASSRGWRVRTAGLPAVLVAAFLLVSVAGPASATSDKVALDIGLEVLQGPGWSQAQDPQQESDDDARPENDQRPLLGPGLLPGYQGPSVPWLDPLLPPAGPPPDDQDPQAAATVYAAVARDQLSDTDLGIDTSVTLDLADLLDLLGTQRDVLPSVFREALDDLTRVDFATSLASSIDVPVDGEDDASDPLGDGFPVRRVAFGMSFQDHAVDVCVGPDCATFQAGPGSDGGREGLGLPGVLSQDDRALFLAQADALPVLDPFLAAVAPAALALPPGTSGGQVERAFPAQAMEVAPAPGLLMFTVLALGALLPAAAAMYSKIRRDTALRNATRLRIYQSVSVQPGLSIQELARRAATSHSTAAYHLERLTRASLVVPTSDGNKVRFYPNGGRFTERERKFLPCLENAETTRVLETVLRQPWTYRAELAQTLGVTATTVSWHLKRILACEAVCEVREGRNAHLFVDRGVLRELCEGLRTKVPESSPVREVADRLLAQLGPSDAPPVAPASPVVDGRSERVAHGHRTPSSPIPAGLEVLPARGASPAADASWPASVPPRSAPGW